MIIETIYFFSIMYGCIVGAVLYRLYLEIKEEEEVGK